MSRKPRAVRTLEERFAAFVGPADENGCTPWTGYRDRHGYGQVGAHGGVRYAHRIAVELASVSIPEGMQVDHICHNPSCVNPSHLRVVTGAQNKQNRAGATRASKTQIRGVWAHQGKWRACVRVNGKPHYLGLFDTPEAAGEAAAEARRELLPYSEMDKIPC